MNSQGLRPGTPVVLLYHRLGFPKLSSLVAGQYVAPSLFRSELDYMTAQGWLAVPLENMAEKCRAEGYWERDEFAVTFDDGYLSVYEHAYPALMERRMTATVYVVADTIGGANDWDARQGDRREPMMSIDQLREMADNGFEIGSHTLTHPHLPDISDEQLTREIADSKRKLEDILGKEVVSFSYPYGDYDDRVLAAAVEAGYRYAVTTKLGIVGGNSVFEIPRVNVRWNAIGPFLMRKINRARKASGVII
ncbi:MAG: polysaccharide deacetylase family protein [Armatimonadetes bacterium]|nr:polysaccharide deacetylase family protein [Armatimonadota bacterium]